MAKSVMDRGSIKRYSNEAVFDELRKIYGGAYDKYRNDWETAGKLQVKEERPSHLLMELTSHCNMLCKMCYRNYVPERVEGYMKMEIVDKIVCEAKALKVPSIFLGAGSECLLHPEITLILKKFAEVGAMDYWMISNGSLLTHEISEAIIDAQLTVFSVSLDAATPETYEKIRGNGGKYNLETVTRNIMELINLRERKNKMFPRIRLSYVVMDENEHEVERFKKQWDEYVDMFDFQALTDYALYEKIIEDVSIEEDYHCPDPFSRIVINYKGDMHPCVSNFYRPEEPVNIQDMSIKEYWYSSAIEALRVAVKNRAFPKSCTRCVAARLAMENTKKW
ncbi:MAG: radical SAM protein [Defluviitaleaceae bacterium]|nr:radical SAM protein [Defluviitaleaceae bacterium]MCL2238353.1 radical SAM protein [Defluviitaleaceae bacterium]